MLFSLLRALQSLLMPPGLLVLALLMSFIVGRKHPLFGRLIAAFAGLALYLLSIAPVSDALIRPLERNYPRVVGIETGKEIDAVVVLGGGVRDLSWIGLESEATDVSLERVVAGVRLARKLRCPLMLVGGVGDPSKPGINEADAMARVAAAVGFPERSMIVVNQGRDTRESARAAKERMSARRIMLVTSAYHLERSERLFREQGFEVTPEASGYLSEGLTFSPLLLLPRFGSFHASTVAISEYESQVWDGMLQRVRSLR